MALAQGICILNMNTVSYIEQQLHVKFKFLDRCTNKQTDKHTEFFLYM